MASLIGTKLPDLALAASDGSSINLSKRSGTTIVFCYPYTGRPDHPNPPGWDDIPGAHGSTPQALGFSKLYPEFETLQVKIFGVSFQPSAWQQDFAIRNQLPFQLLSDENLVFSKALQLETFNAGGTAYLTRRCLIVENATITTDLFPIQSPENNAAEVLALLRS